MSGVIFGISGSIAAFKGLEVIRLLVADGVEVYPAISEGGAKFVTRTSIEAITGNHAVVEIFPEQSDAVIEHIVLAQKADLLVTCPASADIIAKYAVGIADDPLGLIALAFGTPHLIAPAMNHRMWEHPATKRNVEFLRNAGCVFAGPDKGMMACGEEGWGRLAPVEDIYGLIKAELGRSGPLEGKKVLVTAGATREAIDRVRYLTNHSSGKMGHALAAEARNLGASVVLVTASGLKAPSGTDARKVSSAAEMAEVVLQEAETSDAVIMAAAVADYRPVEAVEGKVKKAQLGETPEIRLERTRDILAELGSRKRGGQVLIGFAAEYGPDGIEEAKRKCAEKKCDMVCLNDVSREDTGFASDENEIIMIDAKGVTTEIPRGTKSKVARCILERLAESFR